MDIQFWLVIEVNTIEYNRGSESPKMSWSCGEKKQFLTAGVFQGSLFFIFRLGWVFDETTEEVCRLWKNPGAKNKLLEFSRLKFSRLKPETFFEKRQKGFWDRRFEAWNFANRRPGSPLCALHRWSWFQAVPLKNPCPQAIRISRIWHRIQYLHSGFCFLTLLYRWWLQHRYIHV